MPDKSVRDELVELTEVVRELRDREVADTLRELRAEVEKLRAEKGGHHCHGCSCAHVHWYPLPGTVTSPAYTTPYWQVTVGSGTSNVGGSGSVVASAASSAGYNPATTTLGISN
jgi:hypothetical protein